MHNSLRILTCITLLCFSFSMFAQFEKIIEQDRNIEVFDTYVIGGNIFTYVQEEVSPGVSESFIVKGDENMENRDSLDGMTLSQGKAMFCVGSPIGDTTFPVIVSKLKGPQDYETDLVFVDTSFNIEAIRSLGVSAAMPYNIVSVNDSMIYLYGSDVLGDRDLYIGAYRMNGDLLRDSVYDFGLNIIGVLSQANGDLVLSTINPSYNFNHQTFAIDTVSNGDFYRGDYKFQMLPHVNGYTYMTGWIPIHGNISSPTIGLYVKKFDSSGVTVDSTGIEFSRGQDVYSYYRESCVLTTGDLLLPYRWDSVHLESVYLRLMIVDENLNVKRTIKRFFDRDFFVSSSAALSDGGAVVFGRILDTVDFGYDTYFLRLDSLGNFSPLTIIDDVAPKVTSLSLYPNPADDHIFIKGIDDQALIDVLVMNEAGQLEQKTQLSYPFKLETSDLPSGVYTLLLLGAEGNNTSLKMVKN